ncbi:MAG: DUF3300 domain-containing protein [Desulforhabdus sp.]|jgi:hypothetical protein|nr:DUF3300 domain-containing protein [Desulforhabdus sp.]
MKTSANFRKSTTIIIGLAALLLSAPMEPAAHEEISRERSDLFYEPIALHPAPLLSRALLASACPQEATEADRRLEENPELPGLTFDDALRERAWDISHYPFNLKGTQYYGRELRRYDPLNRFGVDTRRYYPYDRYGPVPLPGGDERRYFPFDRYGTLPRPEEDDDRRFPHRYGPFPRPDDDDDQDFGRRRYGPLPRPERYDRHRPHRRYERIPRPERFERQFAE